MSRLSVLMRECIVAGSYADPNIDREKYLSRVSESDDAENYNLFYNFVCECSSMLLVLLFNSGRLCNDRIQEIVREILIIRLDFGEEMEDVWGMIGVVLNHTSPGNSNKHVIFSPIRTAVEDVDNDVEIIQNEQVNKEVEVIDISGDIDDPPII
ncbi:uncharacterized protein LOC116847007 [Odontomachus brunneus]|uniref:uncharacterized protein LOC116847007 n=1 Tax=Odontomachus brunneus TaxID=486640 RepID=UPI0013F2268A|nr:uncharacterized protein LOC116847007 [Odontomachus brunneus]